MAKYLERTLRSRQPGNVSSAERWISAVSGLSLASRAIRGPGLVGRLLLATAGLSLLARGATGFCAMRSALSGEMTLKEGFHEQLQRLSSSISGETVGEIDSMAALYAAELRELHSAESQLATIAARLGPTIRSASLALRIDEYAIELQARQIDLESLLAMMETDTREHPDDAMRALLQETQKMARVCSASLRDAAITASFQRIIHYKIAGYGTVAAYAKALGRTDESGHFADLADRDKAIDIELSQLANSTLNPEAIAAMPVDEIANDSARTH